MAEYPDLWTDLSDYLWWGWWMGFMLFCLYAWKKGHETSSHLDVPEK